MSEMEVENLSGEKPKIDPQRDEWGIDDGLLEELQKLTPTQRLIRHEGFRQLVFKLKQAGREYYGFDPAVVAQNADGTT